MKWSRVSPQFKQNKMKKQLLLLCGMALWALAAFSQTAVCGFDAQLKRLMANPQYVQQLEATEAKIQAQVQAINKQRALFKNMNVLPGPVYEIPVVVHVIYKSGDATPGSTSNPSDATIQAALDKLNASFAAQSGSFNIGASTPIRFALAKRDPSCIATSGILRVDGSTIGSGNTSYNTYGLKGESGANGASEEDIKALSPAWPFRSYYNIWVVWKISSTQTNSYIAGYAYLPSEPSPLNFFIGTYDGAFMMGQHMTATSTTLTHEMGHAMGLYHTFQGGDENTCPSNGNCNTDGDKVCDTDPVKNLLFVSPCALDTDPNPCNSPHTYSGAQKNIMGYGGCLDRLTGGQSKRMMAALNTARSGLGTSLGSLSPPVPGVTPNTTQVPQNITNQNNNNGAGPCNVTLGDMAYNSRGYGPDGNAYYLDNSCNIGTVLSTSNSHVLQVSTRLNTQRCKAWIDFDDSGGFGAGEEVMNILAAAGTHSATIPLAKLSGAVKYKLLRMRIMADITSTDFGPGDKLDYGQTEDFWVSIDGSLPVAFGNITATARNNTVFVNWNTASETNSDHFLVEGSFDGNYFATLAKISSKATEGNSSSNLKYGVSIGSTGAVVSLGAIFLFSLLSLFSFKQNKRWWIASLLVGLGIFFACQKNRMQEPIPKTDHIQYVRIAQVDKDGTVKMSKVVRVVEQ